MVSSIQDFDLLWILKRKENEKAWMEQGKFFPCLHNIIQTCNIRSFCFPKKEMVLYGFR